MADRSAHRAIALLMFGALALASCSATSEGAEPVPTSSAASDVSADTETVGMDDFIGVELLSAVEAPAGLAVPDEDGPDGEQIPDVFVDEVDERLSVDNADVVVHVVHEPGLTSPQSTTVFAGSVVAVAVRTPIEADLAVAGLGGSVPTNGDAAVVVVDADRLGTFDVTVGAEVVARIVVVSG